jgi:hypothetical protein
MNGSKGVWTQPFIHACPPAAACNGRRRAEERRQVTAGTGQAGRRLHRVAAAYAPHS